MALSDKKQVTLTKQELLVLEELMADYASATTGAGDRYSFRISEDVVHSEEQMQQLFNKLEDARFGPTVK